MAMVWPSILVAVVTIRVSGKGVAGGGGGGGGWEEEAVQ